MRANPAHRVAALEPLEGRRLLSVSLASGVLKITGTSGPDDLKAVPMGARTDVFRVEDNGAAHTFRYAKVTRVVIDGRGGSDDLYVDVKERARITGGSGDDTMVGGSAADTLVGGDGADELYGQGGNDKLYGGAGDDLLRAGRGRDTLVGSAGDDRFWARELGFGAQKDTIYTGDGADALEVDAGANREKLVNELLTPPPAP